MPEVKILVVDDTLIARQGTAIMVQTLGFKTDEAANGLEALSNMLTRQYSLNLMDCNMPGMNGLECTKKIREFEKQTRTRIPIIGLSASTDTSIREQCLQAGMDDYLSKSYATEELKEIVYKWLNPKV